ncbi:MAG: NifB/NifX family molybdenum-iron cluster-binding protein [Deltaproteobacteria bacterium]|nr:NifB/NifX family molybdenum-iron cluster-binding protein [Deltaproteobacteria bacterium]
MSIKVAVPSDFPGGLDATMSAHFGHCDCYTIVTIDDRQVNDVAIVNGIPHAEGGCMAPVNYLADNQVQALIAAGMGMRPFMGLQSVGVRVHLNPVQSTVKQALESFISGQLPAFGQEHTCSGAKGHCHS